MRARKKRSEEYEKFGRQTTLAALKKIDGCEDAYFFKVFETRKPEYLWLVFWRDKDALDAARTNPVWREQVKKFEAGNFYKTIPLELVCESLGSFESMGSEKPKKSEKPEKAEATGRGFPPPTAEGE
jgi:heme-degrading monooxygenase HmoA